jgi:hypothetical protein
LASHYFVGGGGRTRTYDLRVMSPTSYHCSTPRYIISIFIFVAEAGLEPTTSGL